MQNFPHQQFDLENFHLPSWKKSIGSLAGMRLDKQWKKKLEEKPLEGRPRTLKVNIHLSSKDKRAKTTVVFLLVNKDWKPKIREGGPSQERIDANE